MNDAEMKKRVEMYDRIREENDLDIVWEIMGVEDFTKVPYPSCKVLSYKPGAYWGQAVELKIPANATWLDLWRLAEQAIRKSGDMQHYFIELFKVQGDGVLELFTGS
jgi:hypothetical protein